MSAKYCKLSVFKHFGLYLNEDSQIWYIFKMLSGSTLHNTDVKQSISQLKCLFCQVFGRSVISMNGIYLMGCATHWRTERKNKAYLRSTEGPICTSAAKLGNLQITKPKTNCPIKTNEKVHRQTSAVTDAGYESPDPKNLIQRKPFFQSRK